MDPGDKLRQIRNHHNMSTREVSEMSRMIADSEQSERYLVSIAWLVQIETKAAVPSIYKLFSLASIYGVTYAYMLSLFGLDIKKAFMYHSRLPVRTTHLSTLDSFETPRSVNVPTQVDESVNLNQTSLLSRMIAAWGRIPEELIQGLDLEKRLYGFVGLEDYTLYPMIRPGAFVEIDPESNKPHRRAFRTSFDRPIYFVQIANEYTCGWCEINNDKLLVLAHHLSPIQTRIVNYPGGAEIIGEVTGIAMRFRVPAEQRNGETSTLQERP
jgi:transcriptional regulator with XRE-family HTH domain